MKTLKSFFVLVAVLAALPAAAQQDRHEVRAGNRQFRKEKFKEADINYRRALVKDSTSFAGNYNLASTQYMMEDYDGASQTLDRIKDQADLRPEGSDYYFNLGDAALRKKDYAAAVDAFKQSLLRAPDDLQAKESYVYARMMLQDQQNQQNQQDQQQNQQDQQQNQDNQDQNQDNQNQNQDQNQDQNQNQDQQQNQDNQDQDKDQNRQGQQPQDSRISPQQAQQMLKAIQAKEKETQDKVKKEKAELLKSKQKDKNW